MTEKKANWKAWASVVLSTFVGAALAFFSMPHESKGTKEMLIGAALAGLSAVIHLLQKPRIHVESHSKVSKTAGEIVAEKEAASSDEK